MQIIAGPVRCPDNRSYFKFRQTSEPVGLRICQILSLPTSHPGLPAGFFLRVRPTESDWHPVKITLLESSVGTGPHQQILASYLVNDTTVIDAGSIGFLNPLGNTETDRTRLSFALAYRSSCLAPDLYRQCVHPQPVCPVIYGGPETLDCIRKHISMM